MGVHHHDWLNQEQGKSPLIKAVDSSLTVTEVMENQDVGVTGANKTITLPPASPAMNGRFLYVYDLGGGTKVFVLAGFGGASTNYDTVTMIAGECAVFQCRTFDAGANFYWYSLNVTAPAAS